MSGSGRIRHGGRPRDTSPSHRSARRPAERARHGDPARQAAYAILRAVADGAYANLETPAHLRRARVGGRDAAFATELVYGATRMRGCYDPVIARCAGRDVSAIGPDALDVLRLGTHQLLSMRVPAHAAVDSSVALARGEIGAGAAGFVNAVLRRVGERTLTDWMDEIAPAGDAPHDPERLAVVHSHPAWIVRALRAALLGHGASTAATVDADLVALLQADNAAPMVALCARPGLADVAELVAAGATPSTLSPVGALLRGGGDPGALPAVRQGRAAVQDEGSQLVPLALHAAAPVATGERWLDLCAGPGGKAALLAALARRDDAVLFANDISEHRTALVRGAIRAAVAAGAQVMVGTGDGRTLGAAEPASFDRVLLDAPCTGLGALRRRPEARWRRTPDDVGALARLQGELLASAFDAARPGGLVAYAACSPHLAETRHLVTDTLRTRDDAQLLDARPFVTDAAGAPVAALGPGPTVQLWPHVHGCDAMFVALIRRHG